MKKLILGIVLFISFVPKGSTQEAYITLKGSLFDSNSKEVLPFASIYIKGTSIGTTTNAEGVFVFHVPEGLKDQQVMISMMGYKSLERGVFDFDKNEKIFLEENVLALGEVVVTREKPLTAKQIVKNAYKAIAKNYPSEPYLLEGFIRDLQNEDSSYVELVECAAKLNYPPNSVKKEPQVELVALRQSYLANKHPWNDQWDRKNSIVDLVEDDFIRFDYGPIKGGGGWKYELESILSFGEKLVYKVLAEKTASSMAVLFIDTESFAFVRIEHTRKMQNGQYYKRRLSNGQQEVAYHIVFEYQEYEGKWYLKYQKEEDAWEIFEGAESDFLLFTKYPKKELFINKIITRQINEYPFVNNLDRYQSIESQASPFDPVFWKSYNAPVQTQELSRIEEYLRQAQKDLK